MRNRDFYVGKVVVITGASSGIGQACAREFARRGARVVLAARSVERVEELAQAIAQSGGQALAVRADVSVPSDCQRLIDSAVARFGRIDVLINNAGVSMRALFAEVDLGVIHQLMGVNFFGAVYCTKHALPHLLQARGSVVGVSSIAGFHGLPGRSGYSASKFALHGFLETLRIEHLRTGLHVLIAAPGFTATNIRFAALTHNGTPQGYSPRQEGRMMTAEAVAARLAEAIIRRRHYLVLTLMGKASVLLHWLWPRLLDRLSYRVMQREGGLNL